MPLVKKLHECGKDDCESTTYYFKYVTIPYSHKIPVSSQRTIEAKVGKLFLCPEHYESPPGDYSIVDVAERIRDLHEPPF